MSLRYTIVNLTFLLSSAKVQGRSFKLSCCWTRNLQSLVGPVPSKGSDSQKFGQEPSPWWCTFLGSAAIASARLCCTSSSESLGLSGWSPGPSSSGGSSSGPPGRSSFCSLPSPSSLGLLALPLSVAVRSEWFLIGVAVGQVAARLPKAMSGVVPALLQFLVVQVVVRVVMVKRSRVGVQIYC